MYSTAKEKETAILVGIYSNRDAIDIEQSLDELAELARTAGAEVASRLTQPRDKPSSATYIGKGKVEELANMIDIHDATMIIFNDELSPAQLRNLSRDLPATVIDRTLLILDIFATRAATAEGKLQVELAQLRHRSSHLSGMGVLLSRLGGGIGTRGPGETKLESDRRHIRAKIDNLNRDLKQISQNRETQRKQRARGGMFTASLVGYTNAGKSTILNLLSDADVLAENKLFATLDTTTRKIKLPQIIPPSAESDALHPPGHIAGYGNIHNQILLTDTVGFIEKLPTHLIKAFRATLEELNHADCLIHVIDASSPIAMRQMQVVYATLRDLNAMSKPIITIYNKIDKEHERPLPFDPCATHVVEMSAKTGEGKDALLAAMTEVATSK